MSQPSESKVAGMWRPIELTDGDIVKLFQSGKHGEANYRQFDGRWYVLDESPELIAETRQEELIDDLKSTLMALTRKGPDECVYSVKEIDRLTADLAAVTKQRDVLFKACVAEINRPIILKAIEDIQVMYLNEDEIKYYADLEAIAAIETGGQNG